MRLARLVACCSAVVALTVGCQEATQPNPETAAPTENLAAATVSITDLGTLPGGTSSGATGINANGDIVGLAGTATGQEHAVLWRNRRIRDLGTLGGPISQGFAINDAGRAVGWSTKRTGLEQAVIWENGTKTGLGHPNGATYSVAVGVNKAGVIVTTAEIRMATWNGGWHVLTLPAGATSCTATAIDGQARAVGHCSTRTSGIRSFIYDRGVPIDLGSPGNGSIVAATAVSPDGVVVGEFSTDNGTRPFRWKQGRISNLALEGADPTFGPRAINSLGEIAGLIRVGSETHAALFRGGTTIDLGTLPGGSASEATGLNSKGQVVGWSWTETGEQHAVLWRVQ
jgi:probable HAF family extracellular repeat protein